MAISLSRRLLQVTIIALLVIGGIVIFATAMYMLAYLESQFYAHSYGNTIAESVFFLGIGGMLLAVGAYLIKLDRNRG